MEDQKEESLVNDYVLRKLVQRKEAAKAEILTMNRELLEIKRADPELIFYTVNITDPYDGRYSGRVNSKCSVRAMTARGMKEAILLAEREYKVKSNGTLRTDGVLHYTVAVNLKSGNVALPYEMWAHYTSQPLVSIEKTYKKYP